MSIGVGKRWKEHLSGRLPAELAREIDVFETQLELRRQGKLDEKVFAETRLRRGAYGQRYDNGQRHDGFASQTLAYPSGALTKGPSTLWDAPGMHRIKIPFGRLTAAQIDALADVAEEYSDGIAHITTRQDVQLHFVHLDDTPALMRRLAAAGITTREACGNTVRNVTACPRSGVCGTEAFDTTPYASALAYYLLGHPDTQDFGRKFKISFSGCEGEACGLASMHDIGLVAVVRDGRRGFEFHVGGGLGAIPHQAKLLSEFVPEAELLPLAQAVCRVFARLGEKKNRSKARLKFLVEKLGIDELRRLVFAEREQIAPDARWSAFLAGLDALTDHPLRPPAPLADGPRSPAFAEWHRTNVAPQRQPG
jgi:sulfite reductase (ferredoxin)